MVLEMRGNRISIFFLLQIHVQEEDDGQSKGGSSFLQLIGGKRPGGEPVEFLKVVVNQNIFQELAATLWESSFHAFSEVVLQICL